MKSMLKLSVQLDAHVDVIKTLILDSYNLSQSMLKMNKIVPIEQQLYQYAIYYRFMRNTGHTTALKSIISDESFPKVYCVFESTARANEALSINSKTIKSQCVLNDMENSLKGIKLDHEIIVFSDMLQMPETMEQCWSLLKENIGSFPQLKQVVFLG